MKTRIAMREHRGIKYETTVADADKNPHDVTWHDVDTFAIHTSSSYDPIDWVERQVAAYNAPDSPCLGAIVRRVALQFGGGYHYEATSLWPSLPNGDTHYVDGWTYGFVGDGVDNCGDTIAACLLAKQNALLPIAS